MMKKKRMRNSSAFTIIELMVVAIILAMLVTFVAPKIFSSFSRTKVNIAKAGIGTLEGAVERFRVECDVLPVELVDLIKEPEDMEEGKWPGEYIKQKQLTDPWGNLYLYSSDGTNFQICSLGADGLEGGEGDNQDIISE